MRTITEIRSNIYRVEREIEINQSDYARSGNWGYLNLADQGRWELEKLREALSLVYKRGEK